MILAADHALALVALPVRAGLDIVRSTRAAEATERFLSILLLTFIPRHRVVIPLSLPLTLARQIESASEVVARCGWRRSAPAPPNPPHHHPHGFVFARTADVPIPGRRAVPVPAVVPIPGRDLHDDALVWPGGLGRRPVASVRLLPRVIGGSNIRPTLVGEVLGGARCVVVGVRAAAGCGEDIAEVELVVHVFVQRASLRVVNDLRLTRQKRRELGGRDILQTVFGSFLGHLREGKHARSRCASVNLR